MTYATCGCGSEIPTETAAQRHAAVCPRMGEPRTREAADACPTCGNTRHAGDTGPRYVVWVCPLCGTAREDVIEPHDE